MAKNKTQNGRSFKLRMIGGIIKDAGLVYISVVFLSIFLLCSLLVMLFDSQLNNYADALWYCFQAVTTIGFGDIVVSSHIARIVTVVLSVTSIFYLAVLTGAVVSYCSELMNAKKDQSVRLFMDQLEHLEDLDKEELARLSQKVREFKHHKQL